MITAQSHLIYIDDNLNTDTLEKLQKWLKKRTINFKVICRFPVTAEQIHDLTGLECLFFEDFVKKDAKRSGFQLARSYIDKIFNTELQDGRKVRDLYCWNGIDICKCVDFSLQSQFFRLFHEYRGWKKIINEFEPVSLYYIGGYETLILIKSLIGAKEVRFIFPLVFQKWLFVKQDLQRIIKNVKSVFTQLKQKMFMDQIGVDKKTLKNDVVFASFADNYIEPILPIIKDCDQYKIDYGVVNLNHCNGNIILKREGISYAESSVFWRYRFLAFKILYMIKTSLLSVIRLRRVFRNSMEYSGLKKWLYKKTRETLIFEGGFALEMAYMAMNMSDLKKQKFLILNYDFLPYVRGVIEGARQKKVKTLVLYSWGGSGLEEHFPSATDYVIADSDINRDIMIKRGYSPSSIKVASNSFLSIYQNIDKKLPDRLTLCKKYNIDPNKKVIFFPTQPYSEGMFASDIYQSLEIAYKTFSKMQDVEFIIKLHYKETDFELYEYLQGKYQYGPRIFHNDCNIDELIKLADIMIVICTSVGRHALIAGKSLIQYLEQDSSYNTTTAYYDFGAALTYSSEIELNNAVSELLFNSEVQKKVSSGMSKYLATYLGYGSSDKRKTEREIINALLSSSKIPKGDNK